MSREENPEAVSTALQANLAETRSEVEIPEAYAVLLEAVADYYGVRSTAASLLTEFFHPYRNLDLIAKRLKTLGGMFHYYDRSPERVRCAELVNDLFADLFAGEPEPEILRKLIGIHLQLFVTLSESEYQEDYAPVLEQAIDALAEVQERDGSPFLPYSGFIKRIGRRLSASDTLAERLAALYRGLSRQALDVFQHTVDLESWYRKLAPTDGKELRKRVIRPISDALRRGRDDLAATDDPRAVLELPNADDLLTLTLEHAATLDNPVDRIALYVYLAGVPELQYRNMEVLRTLYFSLKKACDHGTEDDIFRAVDLITDHLERSDAGNKHLLYKCLEKLGQGIARKMNHRLTEHFVERVIAAGFEGPDIRGVSEEWEVWVNPHHIQCLRTWLATIENDPIQFEQLLSALVINLHFKGVFVSDTDLFQRDISALLNSDIADAFNLIMQVVTFFPVFFNEVGSEGELRDVSTRVDQIAHRQDAVIHYLRKQSHAESNNRLIGFARSVVEYWRTGRSDPLEPYLPAGVYSELSPDSRWFTGVHRVARHLEQVMGFTEEGLDTAPIEDIERNLETMPEAAPEDCERVLLLIRLYRLLKAKYSYTPDALLPALDETQLLSVELRRELRDACASGNHLRIVSAGNRVATQLKATIVDTEVTEAFENIFLKRHIAAGIPSMYGTYREPKFDSMGLLLRMVQFLKPHLENLVAEFNYRYMTRESIREAHAIMREMLNGLRIAGLRVHHLSTKLDMLERGIALGNLTASQYLNIFDFMSEALQDVIESNYIALHSANLERVTRRLAREEALGDDETMEAAERRSEEFLRAVIASTFAIQEFDVFLRRILRSLRDMTDTLSDSSCGVILSYQPNRLISPLAGELQSHEDQLYLGAKGFAIKKLKSLGLPVPDGFIISTELFHLVPGLRFGDLRTDTRERIVAAVHDLEERTGRRLGDSERPLLLSVRSGSTFSMPGMMDTILNVGLDQQLLEALASSHPRYSWGVWDSYRRYIQNVAMSCGVSRDLFDELMVRYKERYEVEHKVRFTPEQMREMAQEYRSLALEGGATLRDGPIEQLVQAVYLVLASWESETARVYREHMGLSSDWGTGVIVQRMVFGNSGSDSGSGVTFTRSPWSSTSGVGLFGDFTVCSQGEDVVGGLVRPLPVTEKQRLTYSPHLETSLESAYPAIYERLREIAGLLVNEHGYEHQEIEFTFESSSADDLHLLQTRPMRLLRQKEAPVFAKPTLVRTALLGTGLGVGGGAMCGAVAFTAEDVNHLRATHGGRHVILLRPDTVPEDIPVVVAADGLLTARGGFTSHAAVTAKRLGKTCVVNCKELAVSDTSSSARIGSHTLRPGDLISIDGWGGGVYFGDHEITTAARHMPLA